MYHNAAEVIFVLPYQALKPVIVGGTETILRLAAERRRKHVHFVGTMAALLSSAFLNADRLPEIDAGDGDGLPMGYAQAKWVAEQLVVAARDRGLETTIYRPSLVSGHSETGDCKFDDLIPRLTQGCVELGCAPDFGAGMIDFSPVDFVSRAIVYLSRQVDNAPPFSRSWAPGSTSRPPPRVASISKGS